MNQMREYGNSGVCLADMPMGKQKRRQWRNGTHVGRKIIRTILVIFICTVIFCCVVVFRQVGVRAREVARGDATFWELWCNLKNWAFGTSETGEEDSSPKSRDSQNADRSVVTPPNDTPNDAKDAAKDEAGSADNPEKDLYAVDLSDIPEDARAIIPVDLWKEHMYETEEADFPSLLAGDVPTVLLCHAHAGEGYTPAGVKSLARGTTIGRGEDKEDSVFSVGTALATALQERGVGVIHLETAFDSGGNAGAFDRMKDGVAAALAAYPTIRYVIDIHREAGVDEDGNIRRTVTQMEGEVLAQVNIYAPSGKSALLGKTLDSYLNAAESHLCLGVTESEEDVVRQDMDVYFLRMEIGAAGNSLVEAQKCADAIGRALYEIAK